MINRIEFDLDKALDGEPFEDQDGKKFIEITVLDSPNLTHPVIVVDDEGHIYHATEYGAISAEKQLYMVQKGKITVFANTFKIVEDGIDMLDTTHHHNELNALGAAYELKRTDYRNIYKVVSICIPKKIEE